MEALNKFAIRNKLYGERITIYKIQGFITEETTKEELKKYLNELLKEAQDPYIKE